MSREAIEDRRQRAREAYWGADDVRDGLAAATETATRVKITDEAIARIPHGSVFIDDMMRRSVLRAALAELGFEVEE